MSIKELISTDSNVMLVMSAADLKEFALELMDEFVNSSKNDNNTEKYLTTAEVMKMLNVSEPTLWRWSKNGYLPKVKLGRKCFYRENDIIKLVEGGLV